MKAQTVPDTCGLVPGIHAFLPENKTWMAGLYNNKARP